MFGPHADHAVARGAKNPLRANRKNRVGLIDGLRGNTLVHGAVGQERGRLVRCNRGAGRRQGVADAGAVQLMRTMA